MNKGKLFGLCTFVLMLGFASAQAQSQIGLKGIGGKLSIVSPENIDTVIGLGAMADLGLLVQDVRLEAGIDYWSKSESAAGVKGSVSDFTLCGLVKYKLGTTSGPLTPYVAGGLGFHIIKGSIDLGFLGKGSDTTTKLGVDLGGGVKYAVNQKTSIIGEALYRIVSDVNQLAIRGGVLFSLEK